jgi:hypothetical protein
MRHVRLLLVCLVAVFALLPSAAAQAADTPVAPDIAAPSSLSLVPPGFSTDGRQALAAARADARVKRVLAEHPGADLRVAVNGGVAWDVQIVAAHEHGVGDVDITADGRVINVWTGVAALSYMARGHHLPAFERPWVWLTFGLLFLVPFVDPRRLRRLLHLDLAVLLSFGAAYALFTRGNPDLSVWLVYPPLLYLLGRLLLVGFRKPARPRGRLVPLLPTAALLVGVVALFGARVALNVTSDRVMDIGYASVVGADRVVHKQPLYDDNDYHGDTYGPLNYISYIPFEMAFPWKGAWDGLPAAHAATLFFDLMTMIGLFLLGLRFRAGPEGRRLGLAMAWAWAAFPFTLMGVMESTNDGLVAMFVVFALLAIKSAPGRGALIGAAAAAKFMPGGLLLLFARGVGEKADRKAWLATMASGIAIFVFAMLIYLPDGGLRELWDCTLGYQISRAPDLSPWTTHPSLVWTQKVLLAGAAALVAVIALVPGRNRTLPQVAALAGAITIAFQLPAGHWFYFYIMWFAPLALFALFSGYVLPAAAEAAGSDEDAAGSEPVALDPPRLALAS